MSEVIVAVYDLSQGMAEQFSSGFLGRQIDGIWHTGIIVFGQEYYFGGGICRDAPGATPYGMPVKTVALGSTRKSQVEFNTFLQSVSSQFSMQTYDLFSNNCNNFSDACAMFLVDRHIPQYILDLPNDALNSPMGPMLRNLMGSMQGAIRDQSAGHEMQFGGDTARTTTASVSNKRNTEAMWRNPVLLTAAKREAVLTKLREFAAEVNGNEDVTTLVDIAMKLPPAKAFPALDLLRLRCLDNATESKTLANELCRVLKRFCCESSDEARPAFMMGLRCAVNCFKFEEAAVHILRNDERRHAVINAAIDAIAHSHKGVGRTGGILALNLVGAHHRHMNTVPKLSFDDAALLLSALCDALQPDNELLAVEVARFVLQTLAVLVDGDGDALQMVQAFGADVKRYTGADFDEGTQKAARFVEQRVRETV